MAERAVRIAHTEALFRNVNERIAESAERFNARDAEFVCECADPACAERVPATLDQYVEKFHHAVASITRRLDPRAEPA